MNADSPGLNQQTDGPFHAKNKALTTANDDVLTEVLPALTFSTPSEADEYAAAVNGGYCAVVQIAPDRYRRRVFLTLAAAERCVRNARARGQSARIVLAHLAPLYILDGTAQAPLNGGDQ